MILILSFEDSALLLPLYILQFFLKIPFPPVIM